MIFWNDRLKVDIKDSQFLKALKKAILQDVNKTCKTASLRTVKIWAFLLLNQSFQKMIYLHEYKFERKTFIKNHLSADFYEIYQGSVAGSVIQATGMVEFEDGL